MGGDAGVECWLVGWVVCADSCLSGVGVEGVCGLVVYLYRSGCLFM